MKKELLEMIKQFSIDRDWDKFHTGENLAKSISIEANELLELYQWSSEVKSIESLKEELADVFVYCIMMSQKYDLDIEQIIEEKMKKNALKYPVDKAYGNSKKYNEF